MDYKNAQPLFGMPLHDEYTASLRHYESIVTINKMIELAEAELEGKENGNTSNI